MRAWLSVAVILIAPTSIFAQGTKPCEDLKTEIAQKLDAKNVKAYSLNIIEKDTDAGDGKVVGTCEGGSKRIIYHKEAAASQTPSK
jgi:hypothetical protein